MRLFARFALHWVVVISMIATTLAVPAEAASEALQAASASQMAATMTDMPCGDEATPPATHDQPCDCCTPVSCDLSACIGTACLPELPHLVMATPAATLPVPWNASAPPSRLIDTLLRPPIA